MIKQNKPATRQTGTLKIIMVQARFQVGDIRANADRIIQLAEQAYAQAADLVVFPELALVGYPPEDLLHRPGFISQCQHECQRIVAALPPLDVVFGLPVVANNDQASDGNQMNKCDDTNLLYNTALLYNAAIWVRHGKIIAHYYKQSLPNYSVFDEKRYFIAGSKTVTVSLKSVCIGLSICEDVWQPRVVADSAETGAELLLVLNASPYHIKKFTQRLTVLQQRIKETGLAIIYTNMVGGQDELVFDGQSLVVNHRAELLACLPAFQPAQLSVLYEAGNIYVEADSVPSQLSDEAMMYTALVMGVGDFVHQNGFKGVVIGLSGGVDSALTLAIAVDALGAENVHAVMMPSRYTADISQLDAKQQADTLGVSFDVVEIEPIFKTFLSSLTSVFDGAPEDVTEENLQARCRGVLLMAISNKTGRMVLTTGNKSEMAVGYATLYGDMCGGFAPLKDVSKTRVYALCHYRNKIAPVIPQRVLTRPPSAELRADQVDQDSLPDYAVLDKILELSVEQDWPVEAIVKQGIDHDTVIKVINLVQRNEYKRRQSAPGIRITPRAFGRDRRYPISSGYRRR